MSHSVFYFESLFSATAVITSGYCFSRAFRRGPGQLTACLQSEWPLCRNAGVPGCRWPVTVLWGSQRCPYSRQNPRRHIVQQGNSFPPIAIAPVRHFTWSPQWAAHHTTLQDNWSRRSKQREGSVTVRFVTDSSRLASLYLSTNSALRTGPDFGNCVECPSVSRLI